MIRARLTRRAPVFESRCPDHVEAVASEVPESVFFFQDDSKQTCLRLSKILNQRTELFSWQPKILLETTSIIVYYYYNMMHCIA